MKEVVFWKLQIHHGEMFWEYLNAVDVFSCQYLRDRYLVVQRASQKQIVASVPDRFFPPGYEMIVILAKKHWCCLSFYWECYFPEGIAPKLA